MPGQYVAQPRERDGRGPGPHHSASHLAGHVTRPGSARQLCSPALVLVRLEGDSRVIRLTYSCNRIVSLQVARSEARNTELELTVLERLADKGRLLTRHERLPRLRRHHTLLWESSAVSIHELAASSSKRTATSTYGHNSKQVSAEITVVREVLSSFAIRITPYPCLQAGAARFVHPVTSCRENVASRVGGCGWKA